MFRKNHLSKIKPLKNFRICLSMIQNRQCKIQRLQMKYQLKNLLQSTRIRVDRHLLKKFLLNIKEIKKTFRITKKILTRRIFKNVLTILRKSIDLKSKIKLISFLNKIKKQLKVRLLIKSLKIYFYYILQKNIRLIQNNYKILKINLRLRTYMNAANILKRN